MTPSLGRKVEVFEELLALPVADHGETVERLSPRRIHQMPPRPVDRPHDRSTAQASTFGPSASRMLQCRSRAHEQNGGIEIERGQLRRRELSRGETIHAADRSRRGRIADEGDLMPRRPPSRSPDSTPPSASRPAGAWNGVSTLKSHPLGSMKAIRMCVQG